MLLTGGGSGAMQLARKQVAFSGAAGNGAVGSVALFTVTGDVLVAIITAFCTEALAGATANIALGVVGATGFFIPTTLATDLIANEIWIDASPTEMNAVAVPAGHKDIFVTDNIVLTVTTVPVTDGTIEFTVYWLPLSAGSGVVAA